MANSAMSPRNSYSSDSDDEDEWSELHKRSKKKNQSRKKPKLDAKVQNVEEGEVFSDELDDDEDDGLDENLIGGEEDRKKLEKMSEKEREEELFKRAERRDSILARRLVKQKLKEKRDRERAEAAKQKKRSAYANVFSSDTEEARNSDSSGAGPRGLRQRKLALEKRKEAESLKFHELIERRRQKAAKKRRMASGSEDEHDAGNRNSTVKSSAASSFSDSDQEERTKKSTDARGKQAPSMSQRVFSSDASDSSDSSHSAPRRPARRPSLSSLSGSARSASSSEDDARGRSRSPEEELVSSAEDLSRIRLSRFKLEKWVHMPFFDELVKGCFVRINIGLNQGVPVYRCAEIVDVLETPKIYDLGETRTNKGMVVRVGRDQSTFRLAFVSNSDFLPSEFESWLRRITEANMKPPTMSFVRQKAAEIQEAITRPIKDERVVEQIIQSKKRFQKAPTNFALRKAELIKQRELAEAEGDTEALRRLDLELEDIEAQADKIDRRRTLGFKSITSINQRNRVLSVLQAEEAIRKESEEAQKNKQDDPFTRVHSQPVIVTKKYLEQLRYKRTSQANLNDSQASLNTSAVDGSQPALPGSTSASCLPGLPDTNASKNRGDLFSNTPEPVSWSIADEDSNMSTPHEALHAIHNFEININLDLDGAGDQPVLGGTPARRQNDLDTSARSGHQLSDSLRGRDSLGNLSQSNLDNGPTATPNRRVLNLEAYKKQRGLI